MEKSYFSKLVILVASLVATVPGIAQQRGGEAPRPVTAADYARAEKFMGYYTTPLVLRSGVRPTWLPDERFSYRITTADGSEFMLVDPARGTRAPAFDHARLAAALSAATKTTYDAHHLPFTEFELSADGKNISVAVRGSRWSCDLPPTRCISERRPEATSGGQGGGRGGRGGAGARNDVLSPDRKRTAFIRDFNLWVRDVASGKETQLTTDGIKDFGYATDNAGWVRSDRPIRRARDTPCLATVHAARPGTPERQRPHPLVQAGPHHRATPL